MVYDSKINVFHETVSYGFMCPTVPPKKMAQVPGMLVWR